MDVDGGLGGAGAGAGAGADAAGGGGGGGDVRVRFVTKHERYKVTETPFAVPSHLSRYGLSEIVNHLLELESSPVPFDFLVEGEFLRVSLRKHMRRAGLSGESIVTLEYAPAMRKPEQEPDDSQPDWVGAVHGSGRYVATGCYDGSARLYDAAGACVATLDAHPRRAVRAVALTEAAEGMDALLVTGGKDGRVKFWSCAARGAGGKQRRGRAGAGLDTALLMVGAGHTDSVDAVTVDPSGSRVVSGAWDGTLSLWATSVAEAAAAADADADAGAEAAEGGRRKRGRDAGSKAVEVAPLASAVGEHQLGVTAVEWPRDLTVVSGSLDHSVRLWDLARGAFDETAALHGNKVVTGVAVSPNGALIATSHPDHAVRLWDPRSGGSSTVKTTIPAHASWVADVAWAPFTDFLLASAGHDKSVKLWDVRATTVPLHVLGEHEDKALCVTWQGGAEGAPHRVVSGGADRKVKRFRLVEAGDDEGEGEGDGEGEGEGDADIASGGAGAGSGAGAGAGAGAGGRASKGGGRPRTRSK